VRRRRKKADRKRGIFVLPNLITTTSLFFGFFCIICSIQERFETAALAILISMVLDGLDGRIARLTNTTSQFGVEYDSLADLIAFGLAPALMVFLWALEPLGRLGWLAAFLFMACGALRLARYNVQVGTLDGNFFNGLPIPAAAVMVSVTVLLFEHLDVPPEQFSTFLMVMIFALSFLMISTIRYVSFKSLDYFRKKSFNSLVIGLLLLVVIAAKPHIMSFLVSFVYVLSGPVAFLARIVRRRTREEDKTERVSSENGMLTVLPRRETAKGMDGSDEEVGKSAGRRRDRT